MRALLVLVPTGPAADRAKMPKRMLAEEMYMLMRGKDKRAIVKLQNEGKVE